MAGAILAIGAALSAATRNQVIAFVVTAALVFVLTAAGTQTVLGKFLAAWIFIGIALALTFPFWLTVRFLGDPDNGVILASYLGSWLMAGAILAIGAAVSAATKNQVIAFVVSAALVFVLIAAGTPTVTGLFEGWAPDALIRAVVGASLFGHFTAITRGVVDLRDVFYFASIIVAFLAANAVLVDLKKAE